MEHAHFNIRQTPPMLPRSVRHDIRVARGLDAHVWTWNELIKYRYYRSIVQDVFPSSQGFAHLFWDRKNLITVDTDVYKIVRTFSEKLSPASAAIPNPLRCTNGVVLEAKRDNDGLVDGVILDSHFTNGGYNGRWRPNRKQRRFRWDDEYEGHRELVHHWVDDEGLPVWGAGDFNRKDMPKFHSRQIWIKQAGIIKMYFVPPKGMDLQKLKVDVITLAELKTDHVGIYARTRLER